MTSLRLRMMEDMQVRNLSRHTQDSYLLQVSQFARHFAKSPALLGPEDIRAYQVYLTNEKKLAPRSVHVTVAALRFLYRVTLGLNWDFDQIIPCPKAPKTLAVVLSPEEVLHFLGCIESFKHQAILTQLRGFQNKYSCASMACEPSDVLGTTRSGWFGRGRYLLEDGWQRDAEGAA